MAKPSPRALELHCARVWLAEAARCKSPRFKLMFVTMATNARKRAMAGQIELLGAQTVTLPHLGD